MVDPAELRPAQRCSRSVQTKRGTRFPARIIGRWQHIIERLPSSMRHWSALTYKFVTLDQVRSLPIV